MATTQEYIDSLKRDKQNIVNDMNRLGIEMTDDATFTDVANELSIYEPPVEDLEEVVTEQKQVIAELEKAVANKSGKAFVMPDGMKFGHSDKLPDLSNFDMSSVTDMSYMFYYCINLTNLDLSNFDTSKITYMNNMFHYCQKLTNLDLSNFNTSKVTNMNSMFYNCQKLTILDLSNFDTSKVTNMGSMFRDCSELKTIDVSNFNTSLVTNMNYMFNSCSKLTNVDVSNFDTSKVTDMTYMFYYCPNLTNVDVSNFNTSLVAYMSNMFGSCSKLTEDTLKSILKMLKKATKLSASNKTLKYIGLSSTQATKCTTFDEWQDLVDLNWTTGY